MTQKIIGSRLSNTTYQAVLCLIIACITLFMMLHLLQGSSPLTPSRYNTYTLQAMQWRKGKIALEKDYPHLELAIYQDKYYVSFPPVPTIPVFFLTFLFADQVPDTLLIQLYAIMSCLMIYRIFRNMKCSRHPSLTWAFLFCFGSSLLNLLQNGAVWYQAQVLAFLLTVAAIERIQSGKPTSGLLFYALSVGCRPFQVLYGPLLIAYYLIGTKKTRKEASRSLLPGVLLGLLVASLYGVYNFIRFGDILEFGHNYLPEFSSQGGIQFSLNHIKKHAGTFLLGLPFYHSNGSLVPKRFGFSFFIANPIYLCLCAWQIRELIKKQFDYLLLIVFGTFVLHCLILLTHSTCGGFQFGARYFIDCIPYALLYLVACSSPPQKKVSILNRLTSHLCCCFVECC